MGIFGAWYPTQSPGDVHLGLLSSRDPVPSNDFNLQLWVPFIDYLHFATTLVLWVTGHQFWWRVPAWPALAINCPDWHQLQRFWINPTVNQSKDRSIWVALGTRLGPLSSGSPHSNWNQLNRFWTSSLNVHKCRRQWRWARYNTHW